MVGTGSGPDPYDEGYPRSSAADLDPGPDASESLGDADRAAGDEHRVGLGHRRPDWTTDDEDTLDGPADLSETVDATVDDRYIGTLDGPADLSETVDTTVYDR